MRYFLVLIAVNLMWAFQFSGAKIATERLGPVTVTLIPMALSTLLLALPAALAWRKRSGSTISREALLGFVLIGAVGTVASQLGLTWGVERSLASNAAVLTLTIPVFTAALAGLYLGERMNLLRWVSFALAILGAILVSGVDWRSVRFLDSRYATGNGLILVSCLGSAFINSYSKKLLAWYTPAEVLAFSFVFADAVLLLLALWYEPGSFGRLGGIGAAAWTSLLCIAVFSLSVSMLLFFWVIERIDVTQASLSIYLLPVLGVLLSAVLLKEKLTWQLAVGSVFVFLGTFLVTSLDQGARTQ